MGRKLADGSRPVFAASAPSGSEPAAEFLDELPEDQRNRMIRQLEKLAAGHQLSKERFRQVRGKIWEVKDYQRRMLCFANREGYHLTHGFIKKTSKPTRESEIEKAETILRIYEAAERKEGNDSKNEARPTKRRRRNKK